MLILVALGTCSIQIIMFFSVDYTYDYILSFILDKIFLIFVFVYLHLQKVTQFYVELISCEHLNVLFSALLCLIKKLTPPFLQL